MLFLLYLILDVFYLGEGDYFIVELTFSVFFVILFEPAYRHSKAIKNKILIKSLYVLFTLLLVPMSVTHFHNVDFNLNVFFMINTFVAIQSVFYLCLSRKLDKKTEF